MSDEAMDDEDLTFQPTPGEKKLLDLTAEFDGMLERMQTPEAREAADAAFHATPEELGKAAVRAAMPPLGLTPKWLRDEQRAAEILAAMGRYVEVGRKIPRAWLDELAERMGER